MGSGSGGLVGRLGWPRQTIVSVAVLAIWMPHVWQGFDMVSRRARCLYFETTPWEDQHLEELNDTSSHLRRLLQSKALTFFTGRLAKSVACDCHGMSCARTWMILCETFAVLH